MLGTWSPEVIEGANRLVMKCACIDNLETCEEKKQSLRVYYCKCADGNYFDIVIYSCPDPFTKSWSFVRGN